MATEPEALQWGPATLSSWREAALTRVHELDALYRWMRGQPPAERSAEWAADVRRYLDTAREAALRRGLVRALTGAAHQRVNGNCDAAEALLLRMAPDAFVVGQLPRLKAHVKRHMLKDDPDAVAFLEIVDQYRRKPAASGGELSEQDRTTIVAAVRAASQEAGREQSRIRSFRNVVGITTAILMLLALGAVLLGLFRPTLIPLCFTPQHDGVTYLVCPTGQAVLAAPNAPAQDIDEVIRGTAAPVDLLVVEVIGLGAAALAIAQELRRLQGSSVPFGLPVALAALKLPTGALTAVFGLLLMRGEFIPGLSALDNSAQIIAWAVILGYAQQVFTRFVDQQGQELLNRVGAGKQPPPQRRPAPPAPQRPA